MKPYLLVAMMFCLVVSAYAEPVGLTNYLPDDQPIISGRAAVYTPVLRSEQMQKDFTDEQREGWVLADSLNFEAYLAVGDYLGVQFSGNAIASVYNLYGQIMPEAEEALAKSPKWLRPALQNTFQQLEPDTQVALATEINNSFDPYIDEIAYAIAHSSPEFLNSEFCHPELFTLNSMLIYINDMSLDYVEIVDYGTSATDENYYSTAKYWKIDANGDLVQFEIPQEIYYMYVVHPKNTDEISAFIDPDIIESNTTHQNNIALPTAGGKFWREFLFSMADTGYPVLQQELSGVTVFWDETGTSSDDAIHKITNWINDSMEFTSNSERPHQPVRIYRKHIGRCGEHADLTSAATRSALIPCTSILSYSGDHTWNEFWDEEWLQWEPVNGYYNNPLVYENGWGKVFGSVFEIRSDGLLTPVTERYSEGIATITIYA
nr:transglutaminase-like domain-containing protein [Candidatus Cloacimonadota bacterium]